MDVIVVADSGETIDGLHAYLGGAGLSSQGTRRLRDARSLPAAAFAIVIFPDELGAIDLVAMLRSLRSARPELLMVLVTSAPQRLRGAVEPDDRSVPPVVLPKPAFGWTILDAIRSRASQDPL